MLCHDGSHLSAAYLNKAPHSFAYLHIITRASRNFEGTAWASYDIVFQRQAANRHSLEWDIVDTEAYNEAFTGRARVIPRCVYYLGDTHASHKCGFAPAQAPGPAPQLMFPHPYLPPPARPTRSPAHALPPTQGPVTRGLSAELCRLFNGANANMCRYPWCRHTHLCARCRGPHPVSECPGTDRRVAGPAPLRCSHSRGHSHWCDRRPTRWDGTQPALCYSDRGCLYIMPSTVVFMPLTVVFMLPACMLLLRVYIAISCCNTMALCLILAFIHLQGRPTVTQVTCSGCRQPRPPCVSRMPRSCPVSPPPYFHA